MEVSPGMHQELRRARTELELDRQKLEKQRAVTAPAETWLRERWPDQSWSRRAFWKYQDIFSDSDPSERLSETE